MAEKEAAKTPVATPDADQTQAPPAGPEKTKGPAVKLVALWRVDYNGKTYLEGKSFTTTREEADVLIAWGAAKEK